MTDLIERVLIAMKSVHPMCVSFDYKQNQLHTFNISPGNVIYEWNALIKELEEYCDSSGVLEALTDLHNDMVFNEYDGEYSNSDLGIKVRTTIDRALGEKRAKEICEYWVTK